MGESCLVQPLPCAPAIPNESQEVNPLHALEQSVSFGRYMTESLDWGKWSTFSHKRYVEEAEKYARPGSVAQKKAFFEAHYKKVAASKKAAASIEQEGDTVAAPGSESNEMIGRDSDKPGVETGLTVNSDGSDSNVEKVKPEECNVEGDHRSAEQKIHLENSLNTESVDELGVTEGAGIRDEISRRAEQKESALMAELLQKLETFTKQDEKEKVELVENNEVQKPVLETKTSEAHPSSRMSQEISTRKQTQHAVQQGLDTGVAKPPDKSRKITQDSSVLREKSVRRRWLFLPTACLFAPPEKCPDERDTTREKVEANTKRRKMKCGFCFKTKPMPDLYEEKENLKNRSEKEQLAQLEPRARQIEHGDCDNGVARKKKFVSLQDLLSKH